MGTWKATAAALQDQTESEAAAAQQLVVAEAEAIASSAAEAAALVPADNGGGTTSSRDVAIVNSNALRSSALALSELTRLPRWAHIVDISAFDEELPFRLTATFWMNDCTNSHVWQKQKLSALHVSAIALTSMEAFRQGAGKVSLVSV